MIVIFATNGYCQLQDQKKLDSLLIVLKTSKEDTLKVIVLNAVCNEKITHSEYTEAKKYAEEELVISEKIGYKKGIADSYSQIGSVYGILADYPKALGYYQKALILNKLSGNLIGIAGNLMGIGNAYNDLSDNPKAIEYFQRALNVNEQSGNKAGIASSLNGIGNVYLFLSDYPKALDYFQKALNINERFSFKSGVAGNLNNIGEVYRNLAEYPKALEYYQKALINYEQLGNKGGMASNLNNIGEVYYNLSDYSIALEYFQKSLKLREAVGNKNKIVISYNNIGNIYLREGNLYEALKYATKGLSLALEIGAKSRIKEAYGNLAVIDSALGNFRGAYENHKLYMQVNDSMFNIEKDKKITSLAMKYEFDKVQDSTKAIQTQKDAVAKKELQKQRLMRNGFIGGFAVMVLFAGVFFIQRNSIKKGKKRSDELLLNILPEEVAEELKEKGSAEAKMFDDVTVMFTDFKGFTIIAEKLSAKELVGAINYCFSAFDNIIHKYGIEKIKTIGDAYMAAGGLPVENKTHAKDVVNAALEINKFMDEHKQQRIEEGKEIFEIRIGIHTGPVVAGIVGIKKFAYDIWGDAVNLASRMESSGEAGKVNISGSTYELVKNDFTCTYRGKIQAKNKGEVDMYFVE